MHPAPTQIPPDLGRFRELRERHADLVAPVGVEIPDLGTSARITFKPVDVEEFEAVYEGVSERGQSLRDTFKVRPSGPGQEHLPAIADPEGGLWRLSHAPSFADTYDEDGLVGRSEGLRIAAAIPAAAAGYLETHGPALLAAGLIRKSRSLAMQDAAIATAELRLAADRRARQALAGRVGALEARLDEALAASAPSP